MFPSRSRFADALLLARDFLTLEDDYDVDWGLDERELPAECEGARAGRRRIAVAQAGGWAGLGPCPQSPPPCTPRARQARASAQH